MRDEPHADGVVVVDTAVDYPQIVTEAVVVLRDGETRGDLNRDVAA